MQFRHLHCVVVLSVTSLNAQPRYIYRIGQPSHEDQYMLELINRARADPAAEGVRLISTGDSAVQSAYREWNVDTAQIRSMFATYSPRAPLAFSEVLNSVAREHTLDMIKINF